MILVCALRDYRGDKENLICVLDPEREDCFFLRYPQYNINLDHFLDGTLLAVYEYKEESHEPETMP